MTNRHKAKGKNPPTSPCPNIKEKNESQPETIVKKASCAQPEADTQENSCSQPAVNTSKKSRWRMMRVVCQCLPTLGIVISFLVFLTNEKIRLANESARLARELDSIKELNNPTKLMNDGTAIRDKIIKKYGTFMNTHSSKDKQAEELVRKKHEAERLRDVQNKINTIKESLEPADKDKPDTSQ